MHVRIGLALATLALLGPALVAAAPAHSAGPEADGPVLGDYATPIRIAGRESDIDIPVTIQRLAGANITTYAYLICYGRHGTRDWRTLPAFLSAAGEAGIEVWVYLCPPTESQDDQGNEMQPYELDYVGWATGIAQLSLVHPHLTGWAIDDFAGNIRTYTRAYTEQMVTAARNVNPAIKFRPVLYYRNLVGTQNMLGAYRYYIDGVIFPYRNESGGGDTTNSANADPEIRAVHDAISCDSGTKCAHFFFPGNTASQIGWSTSYSQTVTVNPAAAAYGLTLDVWDDFHGPTAGYRFARVLVDNTVVWERDIAGRPSTTRVVLGDAALRPRLAGKTSATLRLQLYDKQPVANFHSSVTFDSLVPTGFAVTNPGLEGAAGWTAARTSPHFLYGFAKNMKPTVMTYAHKHSREPAGPTPAYVGAVVAKALELGRQGLTDGSLVYCLNKTGQDIRDADGVVHAYAESYNVVGALYGAAS